MNHANISYSSIRTFLECPARYKYTYIDRIKVKGQDSIYSAFGAAIHNCIQNFYDNGNFDRRSLISLWKNNFYEEITKRELKNVLQSEILRLLRQGYPMLNRFYNRQKQDGYLINPIATECEFKIPCFTKKYRYNTIISGKIDAIFEKDGEIIIVDYKTTSNKKYWEDDEPNLQLLMYYVAYEWLLNKDRNRFKNMPGKVCLHFLKPNIKRKFNININDRKRLFKAIMEHLLNVNKSDFNASPSKSNCAFCSYTQICNAYSIGEDNIFKRGKKLYPYQKSDVAIAIKNRVALNANDVGLGKTIEMIFVGEYLHKHNSVKNILVITQSNLKYQWQEQIELFVSNPSVQVIDGKKFDRYKKYSIGKKLWNIINYDLLREDIDRFWKDWDMIILDDPSAFKNWKTQIRKAIDQLKINKQTGYKYILTATPIENNLSEMYSIVRYLNPAILGKRANFENKYVVRDWFNNIVEYKNINEFMQRISRILIRNKFEDVVKELPQYSISNVYVDFTEEQAEMYNATVESLKEYLIDNIKSYKRNQVINSFALSKFTYLREICDSTKLISHKDYSGKMNKLSQLVNNILPDKMVIFTEFAKMVDIMQDALRKECNYKIVTITGADNAKEKSNKVNQFKYDADTKILICTDVLKYGQNLQCAHYLINFDLPWNYATLEQRIGRERRVDQKHKVIVLNLIMKNSCEDRIMDILQYKRKLSNIIDDVKYDRIKVPKSKGITYKTLKELIKK